MGCNFCPFAAKELRSGSIHFQIVESSDKQKLKRAFLDECLWLDQHPETSTSFLLCPALKEFSAFLAFVERSERLISRHRYESIYQVASFHPKYCFSGSNQSDAANYTNRSPFPMLHLLREESVERALAQYPNPSEIPERNIAFAREKGLEYMKKISGLKQSAKPLPKSYPEPS